MSSGDDVYGGDRTRTRLPEGEGPDAYGTRRQPARTSRGLITVVSVVVLLIAAIAFANRGGGDSGSADDPGKSGAGAPTAPTGEKPVRAGDGTIPSGFPKTEQGAQSAAANYAVALGGDGMFRKDTRHAIVDAVYTPDVAATRREALDNVYSEEKFLNGIGLEADGNTPEGLTFVSRTNPVGTKLHKLEGDSARVSVWYSSLFGLAGTASKHPVSESWYTNTFDLKWVNGDWKVADFEQKDGPTPVGRDQRASSAEEMSDAVRQFGGFTYGR